MQSMKVMAVAVALAVGAPVFAETPAQLEANKKLVLDSLAAMQRGDIPAASAHMSDDYIQHNPNVPTGKAAFVKTFTALAARMPQNLPKPPPPVIVMAENDLVTVVVKRDLPDPGQPGKTYEAFWFDTYRVKNGLLVEHWDGATKAPMSGPGPGGPGPAPTPAPR